MASSTIDGKSPAFIVIEGHKQSSDEPQLKCFKSELVSIDYKTASELFSGFDTIKAITFSYDISFIEGILSQFRYAEIVLGGDFLVQKDKKINNFLRDVLTNAYEATKLLRAHEKLAAMIRDGDAEFRTPTFILDHRKIYLLKSDDGMRTRVIKASANMSNSAWNGEQMEFYDYDDTPACYEEYERDFETAWQNSQEIPYNVISVEKDDDIIDGNPIIKKVKETESAIILKQAETPITVENTRYIIDFQVLNEQYGELLSDIKPQSQNGFIEIIPKTVEKIEYKFKSIRQKYQVKNVTEAYPSITFDYGNNEVTLNDKVLNLAPSDKEIRHDIDLLTEMFDNFNQFIGDTQKLKEAHFKMMNAIFASPFHAKLRCIAKIRDIEASSLPLYLLVASSTANCGKTFMISAALKMMSGKKLRPFNRADLRKEDILGMQFGCKGMPVFIDELDSKSFAYIKDMIKNPERCEDKQIDTMPMLIFASNNILEPDEIFRKRMVFLRLNGRLPSNIDQSAYKNMGNALINRLGTGFYREYLCRMLAKVAAEIDYIESEREIPGEYYPDLMKTSSDTIISIFEDFGYEIPAYIHHLTWNDDYSINAAFISESAILAIERLYTQNKKAFKIEKNLITIELGASKENSKKSESWINTLPSEMKAEKTELRDCIRITLDRKEFEDRIGRKLGGLSWRKRR